MKDCVISLGFEMLGLLKATFNSERSEDAAACEFGAENRGRSAYRPCVHGPWSQPDPTLFMNCLLVPKLSLSIPSCINCTACHITHFLLCCDSLSDCCNPHAVTPNDSLGMTGSCSRDVGNTKEATPTKTLQATVCSRGSRALMTRRTFDTEYKRWHLISHHEIEKVHGNSPRPFWKMMGHMRFLLQVQEDMRV